MICEKCGTDNFDNARFCRSCGQPVYRKPEGENAENTAVNTAAEIGGSVPAAAVPLPKKKKSKKALFIVLTAVLLIIAALIAYFGFSNDIIRLYMGDAQFAQSIERRFFENYEDNEIGGLPSEWLQFSDVGASTSIPELTDYVFDQYGNSRITGEAEFKGGVLFDWAFSQLKTAAPEQENDPFKDAEFAVELIEGDECNLVSFVLDEYEKRVASVDCYLTGERAVITVPELTDGVLYRDFGELLKSAGEFNPQEAQRVKDSLFNIYFSSYEKAELSFNKGRYSVGGRKKASCLEVSAFFNEELTSELIKNMSDFVKNDQYLKQYAVSVLDVEEDEYERLVGSFFPDMGCGFTAVNYIKANRKLFGKKYILTHSDGVEETFVSIEATTEDYGTNVKLDSSEGAVRLARSKDSNDEHGTIDVDLTLKTGEDDEEIPPLMFDIKYSGAGEAKYNGRTIKTGKYKFQLDKNDKFVDYMIFGSQKAAEDTSEALDEETENENDMADILAGGAVKFLTNKVTDIFKKSYVQWEVDCKGGKVKMGAEFYVNKIGKYTVDAKITPVEGKKAVLPDTKNAVSLNDDSADSTDEIMEEIYTNVLKIGETSPAMRKIAEQIDAEYKLEEIRNKKTEYENNSADL